MQLLEEKKQYIKCNILIKFKQLYLLILCFLVSAILSIAFAIVKFNNGVCISLFFTIAILISVLVIFFNIKSYSEKLWESVFGQITYFRTKIEMDNENISIKRDGLEYVTTKPITDIIKIEKFGADVVITFADKTSVVLSQDAETNDFESFLAKEQINAKISFSQKSFVNKIMVLLSICTFIIAFLLSYIFSDALILGVAAWIQYSYIMYFFAIITLIIFIVSIVLKSKQGTIVAIVAIAFIALFGSFRFFFNSQIIYDTSRLNSLEQRLNYELPEADRMITMDNFYFSESVGKFQGNAFVDIETSIKNDENWLNELSLDTVNKVSNAVSNELKNYNDILQ